MRVLVLIDDPVERRRSTSALALRGGVELREVTSLHGVLDADVDVMVIDGDRVPQGGYSALYQLRAAADFGEVPAPPALVLTAREQDEWLARWAGANATLRKPVDPFLLARAVDGLVGTSPAERGDRVSADQVDDIATSPQHSGLIPGD